mmetsp:Transcript_56249/g.158544  ORF Transcript_56249/g.158544 Transcript_56249/m.158544 type:complete len:405 (+) Transcript_56249:94-1308(+)
MPSHAVIIGGGLSGKHAAALLVKSKDIKVTVIQANKFVEWPLAMAWVLTQPQLHDKALAADPKAFEVPNVAYSYDVVTGVNSSAKTISLRGGPDISYDVLIVAPGFGMPLIYPELGVSVADRKKEIAEAAGKIKAAGCVVVAGGGAVGLEVAGCIKKAYPEKAVKLLCRGQILKQYPEKVRRDVEAELAKANIEVVRGALENMPTEVKLEPGVINVSENLINYDVFLPIYSRGPNTSFLGGDLLDGLGNVKVNEHLQSTACKEVFAVGVADVDEGFIGMPKLEQQWKDVAANAAAVLAGKPLKVHKEGMPFMKRPVAVTLGSWAALDFSQAPPPVKCCCCCGQGGFPCCPPPCCWPCCGLCACGYCCGSPSGEGTAKLLEALAFKSASMHFKGMGLAAPEQQTM